MTAEDATHRFLEILNFVVEYDGYRFQPTTPLASIIKPGVTHPETFIGCIAGALEIEPEEVDQMKIVPETDTVLSMFERLVA